MSNASSHPFKSINLSDKFIVWTLLASLLAHVIAAWVIPNMSFDDEKKKPEPIKIELVKKPEPVAIPEPVKPPPPKPKPKPKKKKPKPKKIKKPKPKPLPVPKPIPQEIIPEPVIEPIVDIPPEPEVIAVEPVPEAPPPPVVVQPAPVVAPPQPIQPPRPSQADISDARNSYGGALFKAIAKHKKYPRIAQTRGWQGKVILELKLNGQGKLISKKVIQSSGHKALDKQALKMVEKAVPLPVPPKALRDGNFTIKVSVPFKLAPQ